MQKFFSKVAFILLLENNLGKTRTVEAYCLNFDLKCLPPCVVHFSRICWVWLEVYKRIWNIPCFKCHRTDHSRASKHLLSTFPVYLFSLPKKGCLLGEQSQTILAAWYHVKGLWEVFTVQPVDSLQASEHLDNTDTYVLEFKTVTCCCSY